MREILGWIDMFFVNLLGLGLVLLVITVVLAIIVFVLEMIFGEPKISKKASADILAIPYNHNRNATDEAQRRFMGDHIRAHEMASACTIWPLERSGTLTRQPATSIRRLLICTTT